MKFIKYISIFIFIILVLVIVFLNTFHDTCVKVGEKHFAFRDTRVVSDANDVYSLVGKIKNIASVALAADVEVVIRAPGVSLDEMKNKSRGRVILINANKTDYRWIEPGEEIEFSYSLTSPSGLEPGEVILLEEYVDYCKLIQLL
jgi:hypothetical protein